MNQIKQNLLDLDLDWFAIDRDGHIAHFTSGGWGAVPVFYLEKDYGELAAILNYFESLPIIGTAKLVEPLTCPPEYLTEWNQIAVRGIYSYDFIVYDGPYSCIATPDIPLNIDQISSHIQKLIKNVIFNNISFSEEKTIDPKSHIDCNFYIINPPIE